MTSRKSKFDCVYDAYISLDFPTIAEINAARAGGSKEGFEGVCGAVPAEKYFSVDTFPGGPDQNENSRRQVTDILTTLPDAKTILVISPNSRWRRHWQRSGRPTWRAARTRCGSCPTALIRASATPSATSPSGSAYVAYFPERYGELVMPLAIALAKGETGARAVARHARVHRRGPTSTSTTPSESGPHLDLVGADEPGRLPRPAHLVGPRRRLIE